MKKIILILLLLATLSCGNRIKNTLDKNELVVGMELQFPPFETIDRDGKPYGLSVDLAYALGEYLGKKIKIEEVAYSGLISSLNSGKIDLIISSMTITESRAEQITFSIPYANAYLSLLINANSKVQTPDDINFDEIVIAVKRGTTGQIAAQNLYPKARLLVFDKESEAVLEVSQGKADVFIYDVYSVYKNQQAMSATTRVYLKPIAYDNTGDWGIGLRKSDVLLTEKVNDFIKEYSQSASRETSINKHLSNIKEIFEKENIPFFFN